MTDLLATDNQEIPAVQPAPVNLVTAESAAVAAIENAFTEAGWSDGWGLTDAQVRQAPSPLFYRNATPKVAGDAKVILSSVGHTLYAVYNIMDPEGKYADNKLHHFNVTIAITLYYDDASLFNVGSGFDEFLSALLSELSDAAWIISGDAEGSVASASDKAPYIYRKVLYATNTF